jgi:hypothetical protein
MKKILTLICCTIVLAATSCKKETIVQPSANTKTAVFDVPASAWTLAADGTGYYADVPVKEIDDYLQHNGAVLVYISFNGELTYEQVPETYQGVAYSFNHQTGSVRVIAEVYDGQTPTITKPGACVVKVVLIDSNQ